jgi:hypothetical protein
VTLMLLDRPMLPSMARRTLLNEMLRGPASPSEAEAESDSDEESTGCEEEQVDCGKELRTQTVSALRFAVQVLTTSAQLR